MSLYDIAYVTWPVLLALLVAVPGVLLFANRRAWKNGYDEGWQDREQLVERGRHFNDFFEDWDSPEDAVYDKPIDVKERLKQYLSRVDPPSASY